ncbi:MAG TPA: hypothetical protein DCX06_04505 [Opitutae bacterium]|nr:hypothetical protein [Opitutae bacterium]
MLIGVALVSLLYAFVWLSYYSGTALGQSPALDNQQTLLLAEQMANHRLPAEPFHRAPLYPYILSIFLRLGIPLELLPDLARALNAAALLICATTISLCSTRIWKSTTSGWISGLLIGLNPVMLFFAGDPFDILMATACLCLALHQFVSWNKDSKLSRTLWIALFLSLGSALRSHLLPLALIWPMACLLLTQKSSFRHLTIAAIPVALSFLLLGIANKNVADEFRIMPWQGAYNLWAGNGPEASGKIYTQSVRVEFDANYDNPAKLESLTLYQAETGDIQASIDKMNAYWKAKTFEHISKNPLQWLGLMLRKSYYFLNNYEQYDNKTYNLQKQLHWPLRWNPIHWGALLSIAVIGALIGLRDIKSRNIVITLILLFALYAAGTIWFYTPNRFRVPMIPILSLLCGGSIYLKSSLRDNRYKWKLGLSMCILTTLGLAYSNFYNAHDTNTWEEDYALLSNASIRTGNDTDAIKWSKQSLRLNPEREDMQDNLVQAQFNLWAFSGTPNLLSAAQATNLLNAAQNHSSNRSAIQTIIGIYMWKLGQKEDAIEQWTRVKPDEPFAYLCLVWTGAAPPSSQTELSLYQGKKGSSLLQAAIHASDKTDPLYHLFENIFREAE